jgi:hypothetical protein
MPTLSQKLVTALIGIIFFIAAPVLITAMRGAANAITPAETPMAAVA